MTELRTWEMFGGRMTDRGRLHVDAHARTVQMYGDEPVPVLVIEDPEGTHYGWIYTDKPERGPVMIQPHEGMYSMQFPYGPKAEEDAGKGKTVRLRIEDR